MKKFLIPLFVIIISCKSKEVKIPDNVIPQETMVSILKDVHLSEAMIINKKIIDKELKNQILASYKNDILEKHDITMEVYDSSYNFYVRNPTYLVEIGDSVLAKLAIFKTDINQ